MNTLTPAQLRPGLVRRRQVIASRLGATTFETIKWRQLLQDGVLVRLRVGRCGFTTRLLLEDMGIEIADARVREKLSTWLVLGEKRLLPEAYMKALGKVEGGARYLLKEHAFRTELGSFVPVSAYEEWRDGTAALRAEYLALRDEIIANHRDLVRQVVSDYEVIAADTYQRLRATHPDLVPESREQFVTTYCNRIAAQIPSVTRIQESFVFQYHLVDGLSQFGAEPEGEATHPEGETEGVAAQAQEAEPEAISTGQVRQQADQYMRQRQLLTSDLRQHARARMDSALDSFLSTLIGQLRTLTYDAACDVLSTLQRRGDSFAPRSVVQLTNLVTQIRTLNFFGDSEMEQMIARVERIVAMTPTDRKQSLEDIRRTLRAIATTTRSTLLDLDSEPRQARELGIPDIPTEHLVRQARAELGLHLDEASLSALAVEVRGARAEFTAPNHETLWAYAEQHAATRAGQQF